MKLTSISAVVPSIPSDALHASGRSVLGAALAVLTLTRIGSMRRLAGVGWTKRVVLRRGSHG